MLRTLWEGLLDLIYPRPIGCVYCGKEKSLGDHELCAACVGRIEFVGGRVCGKCGKPVADDGMLCSDCSIQVRSYDKALPVALYRGWLKEAIYAFKFGKQTDLAKPFARLMSGRILQAGIRFDAIIPVPMHAARLKQRRFNHTELLAGHVSEFTDLPVWPRVLYRETDTPPQRRLNRLDRERNTDNVFQIRSAELIQDKVVILIDDIYTTGFTAEACATTLLKNGARAVLVSVLAIGMDKSRNFQNSTEYMP